MEKDNLLTIGRVAEIVDLPKSKIRYWDDMKLLTSSRNRDNDYRLFSMEDIYRISDINFYRKLNVPIKKMSNIYRKTPEELWDILNETETRVSRELEELELKKQELKYRKEKLLALIELKSKEFFNKPIDLERVIPIDLDDAEELKLYFKDPSRLVVYVDGENAEEVSYGLTVSANEFIGKDILWEKAQNSYKPFLLVFEYGVSLENNFLSIKRRLESNGLQTGPAIGRYIMTAEDQEGINKDYYEAWVEIYD